MILIEKIALSVDVAYKAVMTRTDVCMESERKKICGVEQ